MFIENRLITKSNWKYLSLGALLFVLGCGGGGGGSNSSSVPQNQTNSDAVVAPPGDQTESVAQPVNLRQGKRLATTKTPRFWELVRTGESGTLLVWGESEGAGSRDQDLYSFWKPLDADWPAEPVLAGKYSNIDRLNVFEATVRSIGNRGAELVIGKANSLDPYSYYRFLQPGSWSEEESWREAFGEAPWQFNSTGDGYTPLRASSSFDYWLDEEIENTRGRGYVRTNGALLPEAIAGIDIAAYQENDREKSYDQILSVLDDSGRIHNLSYETVVVSDSGEFLGTTEKDVFFYHTADVSSKVWSSAETILETIPQKGISQVLRSSMQWDASPSGRIVVIWQKNRAYPGDPNVQNNCSGDEVSYAGLIFDGSQWSDLDMSSFDCTRELLVDVHGISITDSGAVTLTSLDGFDQGASGSGLNAAGQISDILETPDLSAFIQQHPSCAGRSVHVRDNRFTKLTSGKIAYSARLRCQSEAVAGAPNIYVLAASFWDQETLTWSDPTGFEFGDNIQFDQIGVSEYGVSFEYDLAEVTPNSDIDAVVMLTISEGNIGNVNFTVELWAGSFSRF